MKKQNILLGIILFIIGFIGILSILTMKLPIPEETMKLLLEKLTPDQIKLVILINPTIMLAIAIFIGVILYKKVNLKVPIIEGIITGESSWNLIAILKYGIIGGIIAGILITLISFIFYPFLPNEFIEFGNNIKPSLATRFLYGGFTEEIILRFGFMTLVVWIASKIIKSKKNSIYWIGIFISSILFAFGHFPIAFQAVENPSTSLYAYILIGNSIGGIIFGWLYWKKGLESAFIAHIFAHIIMVVGEQFIN